MPAKIARLATRPPFWIPEVLVAISAARVRLVVRPKNRDIHGRSAVIRGIPVQAFGVARLADANALRQPLCHRQGVDFLQRVAECRMADEVGGDRGLSFPVIAVDADRSLVETDVSDGAQRLRCLSDLRRTMTNAVPLCCANIKRA